MPTEQRLLEKVMRVTTSGLNGRDHSLTLARLTILAGPNGSGKSTVADGVRFDALGFIPCLGRRPMDTAALLREREMRIELELGDRTITRTLKANGRGYATTAQASWLPAGATGEEHAVAILKLFGLEELDAAECLDIRQLLQATPQQRAGRLMGLLEAAMRGMDIARIVVRRTVQRLADVGDEQMPADHRALQPLIEREYDFLKQVAPTLQARLKEVGLQGLLLWANTEKREAMSALRVKTLAKKELSGRFEAVPEVDAAYLAGLEGRRSQLEQDIGAAKERVFSVTRKRQIHEKAERVREDEIQHAGGDLIATMHRMLLAAGRAEAPFIRSGKGMVELGWRTAGGCEVFAQALSGGEWVLFAAALTASVILLRNAPARVLLIEAAEADDGTLADLLAAVAAVGDRLTAAVVMTCHAPAVADGWTVVEMPAEQRAERAA